MLYYALSKNRFLITALACVQMFYFLRQDQYIEVYAGAILWLDKPQSNSYMTIKRFIVLSPLGKHSNNIFMIMFHFSVEWL